MSVQAALKYLLDGYTPSIVLTVVGIFLLFWRRLSVQLDHREPPLLKPRVPYIGHIIGLLKYNMSYFDKLDARKQMAIATLPMINAKIYVVYSPALAQSAYRNKNLSFEPFIIDTVKPVFEISDESMKPLLEPTDEKGHGFVPDLIKEIHGSMANEHLHKMNANALNDAATTLNNLGQSFQTDSFYFWIRDMMTMATTNALLGSHSPLKDDPTLLQSLWDFEACLALISQLPPALSLLLIPKGILGRAHVQSALIKYYAAKHDLEPDVAYITKVRSSYYRNHGISETDHGKFELALLHVSTANAIPTLFWFLLYILERPALVDKLRKEILAISSFEEGKACVIDITKFEAGCPLLVSSYRETLRLINAQLGVRRVMEDTTISDGTNTYLLRKGSDVQIPAGVAHLSSSAWGPDSHEFKAERFMFLNGGAAKMTKEEREMSKAFYPFGGGKHLCPGRNFALAEILGVVAALVLGFEVQGKEGGKLGKVKMPRCVLGSAVSKPDEEGTKIGATIVRREGWENVKLGFEVGMAA